MFAVYVCVPGVPAKVSETLPESPLRTLATALDHGPLSTLCVRNSVCEPDPKAWRFQVAVTWPALQVIDPGFVGLVWFALALAANTSPAMSDSAGTRSLVLIAHAP